MSALFCLFHKHTNQPTKGEKNKNKKTLVTISYWARPCYVLPLSLTVSGFKTLFRIKFTTLTWVSHLFSISKFVFILCYYVDNFRAIVFLFFSIFFKCLYNFRSFEGCVCVWVCVCVCVCARACHWDTYAHVQGGEGGGGGGMWEAKKPILL